jgi:hypothetical protein
MMSPKRQMERRCLLVHVTWLPVMASSGNLHQHPLDSTNATHDSLCPACMEQHCRPLPPRNADLSGACCKSSVPVSALARPEQRPRSSATLRSRSSTVPEPSTHQVS